MQDIISVAYLNQVERYLKGKGITADVSNDTTVEDLLEKHGYEFMQDNYPGATMSPTEMAATLASKNPTEYIRAQIVLKGGSDSHVNKANILNRTVHNVTTEDGQANKCDNLLYDPVQRMCYEYSTKVTEQKSAYSECWNKLGYMLYPFSDEQLIGIIKLIEEGPLDLLVGGEIIWVDLTRSADGSYRLVDGMKLSNATFVHLNITNANIDDPTKRCFVMSYSKIMKIFIGRQASCKFSYASLCYSKLQDHHSIGISSKEIKISGKQLHKAKNQSINLLDIRLNPETKQTLNHQVAMKKNSYNKAFSSLDMAAAYPSLFELLWYSQLPCFDVREYFSYPHKRSLLKKCQWKGIEIACSAIFKTVPTDRGMCCTFNRQEADEIFLKSKYQEMVSLLQASDKRNSIDDSELPQWYRRAEEPTSQQGIDRGLKVTLDAHTNLLGSSTVSVDFQGFIATINSKNSYPLTKQKSVRISPGQETLVAMSAIDVHADLQDMALSDRKCFYSHGAVEEAMMTLHKNYSQANCALECQIAFALDRMKLVGEEPCIPWYLPTLNKDITMCNPWSAIVFREQLDLIPIYQCDHCLPDCSSTTYTQTVTAVPIRPCDRTNFGISNFCNMEGIHLYDPPKFGEQVLQEYQGLNDLPSYVKDIQTNERYYSDPTKSDNIFRKSYSNVEDAKYDAYEKDIAVVHFYFESATIFQYSRQARMSWIDFFSQAGGLLGLCLGFSICLAVEVLYWGLHRVWIFSKVEPPL